MKGSGIVKTILFVLLGVVLVAVILFAVAAARGGDKDLGTVTDFSATSTTGESFVLSEQYSQSSVILMFFDRSKNSGQTLLTNVAAAAKDKNVTTVLVAVGETSEKELMAYLSENSLSADIVIADAQWEIAALYNISSCPVTYFINNEGSVRAVSLSNLTPSAAEKYVGYINK